MFSFKEFQKYEINKILRKYINKIHEYDEYFFKNRDKNKYKINSKNNRIVNIPTLDLQLLIKEFIEMK